MMENINGFVQLEGFVSTSLSENSIINFIVNSIMEITVRKQDLGGELDNGFVDLSGVSKFSHEKEILFNAMNMFKIVGAELESRKIMGDDVDTWVLKLEYCPIQSILDRSENKEWLSEEEN